nr:ParB/RepB/Spo0J family partition protein [Bacilli bacterium]
MKPKSGLGRGLEALIPQMKEEVHEADIKEIALEDIRPNPYQPRRVFDQEKLQELMSSISEHGVLQPIVVRPGSVSGFEIIAGERRFRASQELRLSTIPAIVRPFSDRDAMEIALIENVQREDLSPIELAEAYAMIMDHFSLTQEEMAKRMGQSRSHIANLLRLLTLPTDLRELVSRGTLSMGHARAIVALPDADTQRAVADKVVTEGISVREIEQLTQRLQNVSRETNKKDKKAEGKPSVIKEYEEVFRNTLGTSVRIQLGKKRGKIEIDYFSLEDLERILSLIQPHG